MSAQLLSTSQGRTMVLTLSNPGQRNALNTDMYVAGIEALNVAETNPEVRAVVLVGEGACFSAGTDTQRLQAERLRDPETQAQGIEQLHTWIEAIQTFPKPVIAAIEGEALDAGFALALACDFIVAASDAMFALKSSLYALSPEGGASWTLVRALPRQLATELMMTGTRLGAPRLQALGLINRLSDPGYALSTALAWAEQLHGLAPNAVASIKELIHEAPATTLTQQLAQERMHRVRTLNHTHAAQALNSALAGYPPDTP